MSRPGHGQRVTVASVDLMFVSVRERSPHDTSAVLADESANLCAALSELFNNLAADIAGSAGNENGHGLTPVKGG